MLIKKLSKEELAEGITLELVKSIELQKRSSPVQLKKGDEPVKLLICSKGFNVLFDDVKILRDEKNQPIVFSERECVIGRARYLVNFGADEKESRVQDRINSWRETVREYLDSIKKKVDGLKSSLSNDGIGSSLMKALSQEKWPQIKAEFESELRLLEPAYLQAEQMFSENKIKELLSDLGLKKFSNPLLSVKFDNEKEMKIMINTFNAAAIQKWDGDILTKYAEIEIEREFPN